MTPRILRTLSGPTLAILALTASLLAVMAVLSTAAQAETPEVESHAADDADNLTRLTVEGAASRSVSYDGTVARFTVSVLRPRALEAVSAGNTIVQAISESVQANCTRTDAEEPSETDEPTCISPNGLQDTRVRIYERFDWTEQGQVSLGYQYERGLRIAIRGTEYAGKLIDLVITAGGNSIDFNGLDFTTSRRAEIERQAMLDAIDDAQAAADSIAGHMGYEIVRVVEVNPIGSPSASRIGEDSVEAAMADESFEPTPVFGGSETITSRVRMIFDLRPLADVEETEDAAGD